MRNISFFLTTDQIRARTKTVTRRIGWESLKPGTLLRAIVKGQGLKAGECIVPICIIRVVSVRREYLDCMIRDPAYGATEAELEGFPGWSGQRFVDFICSKNAGVYPERELTRIEFQYVDDAD